MTKLKAILKQKLNNYEYFLNNRRKNQIIFRKKYYT